MANRQAAYNYLRGKFQTWNQQTGKLERHVDPRKRDGIASELRHDINEVRAAVCPYIKDVGYAQSKSLIVQAAEGLTGSFFGFPLISTADVILGALMDVCGYVRRGDALILSGLS